MGLLVLRSPVFLFSSHENVTQSSSSPPSRSCSKNCSTSSTGGPLNRKHDAPLRRLLVAVFAGSILKPHNSQMQETLARSCELLQRMIAYIELPSQGFQIQSRLDQRNKSNHVPITFFQIRATRALSRVADTLNNKHSDPFRSSVGALLARSATIFMFRNQNQC